MVAAPMMQKGVEVNLPVARRADKLTTAEPLYVTVPLSYRTDRRIFIDKESVPIDVLAERMRQAMLTRTDKQVYLRGDGAVMFQDVMDVFGRLKEAGVQRVGVLAEERRAQ
jgi:biopolymer transport protein TolR